MSNINVKIKPNLPVNVVQIAHLGGNISNPTNAVVATYKNTNPKLANFAFLKDYSFDVILNDNQTVGELGIGVVGMADNNVDITNIASASRFGNPVPLFYKYKIDNLVIAMPVDSSRYDYLKTSATTSAELEELAVMEDTINNTLLDRIYFTDIYNEIKNLKFNISKSYIAINTFDVTVYIQYSSLGLGSLYIVYNNLTSVFRKILNSVPVFNRKAWHLGRVYYGDLNI